MDRYLHLIQKSQDLFNNIDLEQLLQILQQSQLRYSLRSRHFIYLQDFQSRCFQNLFYPSSDQQSDFQSSYPSLMTVSKKILDTQLIKHTVNIIQDQHYNKSSHLPAISLTPLHHLIQWKFLSKTLEKLQINLKSIQITQFRDQFNRQVHSAVIWFDFHLQAVRAFDILKGLQREGRLEKILGKTLSWDQCVKVYWFHYKVLEPKCKWNAIVVRGIDSNKNDLDQIRHLLGKTFVRMEGVCNIKDCFCTIVVVTKFQFFKKVQQSYQRKKQKGISFLKVGLNPFSSKFRELDIKERNFPKQKTPKYRRKQLKLKKNMSVNSLIDNILKQKPKGSVQKLNSSKFQGLVSKNRNAADFQEEKKIQGLVQEQYQVSFQEDLEEGEIFEGQYDKILK